MRNYMGHASLNLSYLSERTFEAAIISQPNVANLIDRSLNNGKLNKPKTTPDGDAWSPSWPHMPSIVSTPRFLVALTVNLFH